MEEDGWITIPVAASRLHMSPDTLYKWIEEGMVECKTVLRTRWVSIGDIIGDDDTLASMYDESIDLEAEQ